jgi:rhodanese-related sulfurtransferase
MVGLVFTQSPFMQQVFEFIGNHPILSGAFIVLLLAWLVWEVARLNRKWRELDTLAAVRLINQDDAVVIDVSNSTDFAKGHIVGAQHMPPTRIESGNQALLKLRERPVLIYCKHGQISPQIANKLVGLEFTNVNVLAGGLAQWLADQQPVSRHKGAGGKARDKDKSGKRKKGDRKARADAAESDSAAESAEPRSEKSGQDAA